MKAGCIRQFTVDYINTSITYACWYGLIVETWSIEVKSLSKTDWLFTKLLEYIENPGNGQLAAFHSDFDTFNVPNIALKTKTLFRLSFIQLDDILFKNYDFRN